MSLRREVHPEETDQSRRKRDATGGRRNKEVLLIQLQTHCVASESVSHIDRCCTNFLWNCRKIKRNPTKKMSNSTNINISCGLMPDIAAIKVRSGVIFFLIKYFCKVYQNFEEKKHVWWLVLILFVQQYVGQWVVLILLSYYLATVQIHVNCKIINNSASNCLACVSLGYSSNLQIAFTKLFMKLFQEWKFWICGIATLVVGVLGSVGNFLSIFVLCKK